MKLGTFDLHRTNARAETVDVRQVKVPDISKILENLAVQANGEGTVTITVADIEALNDVSLLAEDLLAHVIEVVEGE